MIDKNDPRLTDFVLGELSPADDAELQDAIANSEELQNSVEELRQTALLLGAAYRTESPLSLLDEQKEELVQMQRQVSVRAPKPATGSRPWLQIVLAASLLGILVGGAIYFQDPPVSSSLAEKLKGIGNLDNDEIESLKDSMSESNELNRLSKEGVQDAESDNALFYGYQFADDTSLNEEQKAKRNAEQLSRLAGDAGELADGRIFDQAKKRDAQAAKVSPGSESAEDLREEAGRFRRVEKMESDSDFKKDESSSAEADFLVRPDSALPESFKAKRSQGLTSSSLEMEMMEQQSSGDVGGKLGGVGGGGFGGGFNSDSGVVGSSDSNKPVDSYFDGDRLSLDAKSLEMRPSRTPQFEESGPKSQSRPTTSQSEALTAVDGARGFAKDRLGTEKESGVSDGKNSSDGQVAGEAGASRTAAISAQESRKMGQARAKQAFSRVLEERPTQSEKAPAEKMVSGKSAESEADEFSLPGEAKIMTAPLVATAEKPLADKVEPSLVAPQGLAKESATEEESNAANKLKELAELEDLGFRIEKRNQEVPQVLVDIDPKTTDQLIDRLMRRINPSGTREIVLGEFFEKARELKELGDGESAETDRDLRLAYKLREQLVQAGEKQADFDATRAIERVKEALNKRNAKIRQAKTWKRVKAIPNTTRLMLGDKTDLDLTGMQVNVQVDGFRARVLLDYFYYNDRDGQLKGNFKLRLPDDASLYYFAFGESAYNLNPKGAIAAEEFLQDGTQFVSLRAEKIRDARQDAWKNVKESRMVPREKAAHAFNETVRRKIDPALAEWAGAGVFNAQVFPLMPHKLHRIVVGYDVNLTKIGDQWIYELDLPEQTGQCQVDINVQSVEGVQYAIEPKSDPVENFIGGKAQRRYRFKGPQNQTIRLTADKSPEILLASADEFWGVQIAPELPVEKVAGNPRAVFMVDTSLSSNPDKFNVWLKLLESTLEANRDSLKQFNVVFFSVDAHEWQEKWVDNTQENAQLLLEKCNTLALEGATDLYGAIEKIGKSSWVHDSGKDANGKPMAGPDLFLLSDGAANWGETNLRLIGRQLQDHQLGSLFAYQTGQTGTAISALRFLAGSSGGAVFSVADESEIKLVSTAHRKRPWKLATINAPGANDIMTAGRVQWVYPGQAITIVGRGKVQGDFSLELTQAGQTKTISVSPQHIESELASRMYGQVAVGQLESLGAEVFDVAASYARHFRVTGETCSLLMLESEAEYQRFDIKPQEDQFVIKAKAARELVANTLKKSADELADPKAQLLAWLARLETMPGMSFEMPQALEISMDDIQVVAISQPLDCSLTSGHGLSKEYLAAIENERLDYEAIAIEANRRGRTSVDDAIKVFSSLVERNPGDLVIARDVAFTALELGRPAQAYHLLRSVAKARPFDGSIYPALGQCLTQLGQSDMAIVYYEIALNGSFSRVGEDFPKIVSAEYMYLLRQIVDGKLDSSVKKFAKARLESLKKVLQFKSADLLITMMWNTDETDVDLHIFEPSGEECSYENRKTRSGGQITSDITTGYGPEMYSNPQAPNGKYDIKVKYFASNQSRTEVSNKVHLTIYRGFGTQNERVTRKTVQLKKVGEKESVATVGID